MYFRSSSDSLFVARLSSVDFRKLGIGNGLGTFLDDWRTSNNNEHNSYVILP